MNLMIKSFMKTKKDTKIY